MDFLPKDIAGYVKQHTTEESAVLFDLYRETNLKVMLPIMLSGHVQGAFLKMISQMMRPKNILEVGTYTGYSAICLAEGLTEDGLLYTIDKNPEITHVHQKYFEKAGIADKVRFFEGRALDILPDLDVVFDLVFIDADKTNYLNYYKLIFDKVRQNGFILADNVLWFGKVVKDVEENDLETKGILEFNEFIQNDERVENTLLPIRDGMMLIRKK